MGTFCERTGPAGGEIGGGNAIFEANAPVYPDDAIVMQRIGTQVHETQDRADDADDGEYQQQSSRELVSRFPH
jgi:hypothetical protein